MALLEAAGVRLPEGVVPRGGVQDEASVDDRGLPAEIGLLACDNRAEPHPAAHLEWIMPDLPSATVTFLFTDIEGSTALWEQNRAAMPANSPPC